MSQLLCKTDHSFRYLNGHCEHQSICLKVVSGGGPQKEKMLNLCTYTKFDIPLAGRCCVVLTKAIATGHKKRHYSLVSNSDESSRDSSIMPKWQLERFLLLTSGRETCTDA